MNLGKGILRITISKNQILGLDLENLASRKFLYFKNKNLPWL
jgi:hypothetical protein